MALHPGFLGSDFFVVIVVAVAIGVMATWIHDRARRG